MDNKKLTAALEKKAVYGNDIDLSLCSLITMLWKLK